jgi:hypothetical protein
MLKVLASNDNNFLDYIAKLLGEAPFEVTLGAYKQLEKIDVS